MVVVVVFVVLLLVFDLDSVVISAATAKTTKCEKAANKEKKTHLKPAGSKNKLNLRLSLLVVVVVIVVTVSAE